MKQWAGTEQYVPTSAVHPAPFSRQSIKTDKSTAFDTIMNKERFHNALALSLGYERIVKDKRITIQVDDSDDPWVTLKFQGCPEIVRFKASGEVETVLVAEKTEFQNEVKVIADAVHQAYINSTKELFSYYTK